MIRHLCAVLFTLAALCILAAINRATHADTILAAWWAWVGLFAIAGGIFAAVITPGSSDE